MAYSAEVVRRARQRLAQQKADYESKYNHNLYTAYEKLPRLKEIDFQLRQSMTLAAQAAFVKGENAQTAMERVKEANLSLQAERQALIAENFAPGYLEENGLCGNCGGSGYVGSTMCQCLKALCRQEQVKELKKLTCGQERFEDFCLDYYSAAVDSTIGGSPRMIMELTLKRCRQYAQSFDGSGKNLLFVGNTGLGKTFLSACIANAVAEKGYSVTYESAHQLFEKLNKNQFNPDEQSRQAVARIYDCDLLILDDLGTELPGNFVTAALYSLLNDRLLSGKSMIVSTNLNVDEIARRYSPQIASRLQGNFDRLTFVGEDIRVLKNRGL